MRKLIFIAALALAGCKSEGERAEAQYEIETSGFVSEDDKCVAARKVQQAYLADQDEEKFRRWRLTADIQCNRADIERLM